MITFKVKLPKLTQMPPPPLGVIFPAPEVLFCVIVPPDTFTLPPSTTTLVEIDLLRGGTRFPTGKPLPSVPYFVFISHAERRQEVEVWPIALEQPLPSVPIPLLPDDPLVNLDLQQALTVVYDIIGYDELLDYSQAPPGPLTPSEVAWVEERLRREGRRKL